MPDLLVRNTINAAMSLAAGKTIVAGAVSAVAVGLMERVVSAMWFRKIKMVAAALVVVGVVAAGVGASPGQS